MSIFCWHSNSWGTCCRHHGHSGPHWMELTTSKACTYVAVGLAMNHALVTGKFFARAVAMKQDASVRDLFRSFQ